MVPMSPRLVIFDCDGTLVDSQRSIVGSMQEAFEMAGLPRPTATEIRRRVGLSLADFVLDLAPHLGRDGADRMAADYRAAFSQRRDREGHDPLFPGVEPLLRELQARGVLLGVATGKSRRGLVRLLDGLGLRSLFATLQTADDAPSKPHPGMILQAMEETGCEPSQTVFVGDTVFDVRAGTNAGVTPVGVAWGYHPREELLAAGARDVVEEAGELERLLLG